MPRDEGVLSRVATRERLSRARVDGARSTCDSQSQFISSEHPFIVRRDDAARGVHAFMFTTSSLQVWEYGYVESGTFTKRDLADNKVLEPAPAGESKEPFAYWTRLVTVRCKTSRKSGYRITCVLRVTHVWSFFFFFHSAFHKRRGVENCKYGILSRKKRRF